MKKTNGTLLGFLTLLMGIATPSFSQEGGSKMGIGISLEPIKLFTFGSTLYSSMLTPVNIYLPLSLTPSATFEPSLGIVSFSSESGPSSSHQTTSGSIIHIGGGLLIDLASAGSSRMYIAPRVGILLVSQKSSSTSSFSGSYSSETSETDLTFGAGFGGEYFVSPKFSVGAEAQINYLTFGKPDTKSTPSSGSSTTSDRSQSLITSDALFFFRFYF